MIFRNVYFLFVEIGVSIIFLHIYYEFVIFLKIPLHLFFYFNLIHTFDAQHQENEHAIHLDSFRLLLLFY